MAVTILLCVGGFVVIYAQVDPLTRDFIAAPATSTPTEEPRESGASGDDEPEENTNEQEQEQDAEPADEPGEDEPAEPAPTPTPEEEEPTPTPEGFTPTHVSNTETAVNFRAGPGTDAGIVDTLAAGTPLQATGEEGTADDGLVWLEFETEDGTIGWIREIDAVPQG